MYRWFTTAWFLTLVVLIAMATATTAYGQSNAQIDDSSAQFVLGNDYNWGTGGKSQNIALAATHYRKAADEGDANAYGPLGYLYLDGLGVPQDYAEAYFWLDLTVASGLTDATERDEAAYHLTKSVLLATQERARVWAIEHPHW